MVLLEKLWDDVVAGPHPDKGLGKLRKVSTQKGMEKLETGESSGAAKLYQRSASMPASPATPTTPTTPTATTPKENVWRSVFHPGSNLATRSIGAQVFDRPTHPNSPTVYDWLYSGETVNACMLGIAKLARENLWWHGTFF